MEPGRYREIPMWLQVQCPVSVRRRVSVSAALWRQFTYPWGWVFVDSRELCETRRACLIWGCLESVEMLGKESGCYKETQAQAG